jgi:single-stranded-DNA-specific exonuclease
MALFMHWQLQSSDTPTSASKLKALLVASRKIEPDEQFFDVPSPLSLSLESVELDPQQLATAIKRLTQAKEKKETVVIVGDYDVDGMSATAVLWEGMRAFGLEAQPFIPNRSKHGYGLSPKVLVDVLEQFHPTLIVTVDNGIVAHEAAQILQDKKIDLIITDHHQPEAELPPALAVVHSTKLCGTTVAWMVARELAPEAAEKSLDLAALATIADQMPLRRAHRSFVVHGLKQLQHTSRVGLQAIFTIAAIDPLSASVGTINYAIAPRINAMGRLKDGMDALRLLCTTSFERAAALSQTINTTNIERQTLTSQAIEIATEQAEAQADESVIIVGSDQFHGGIIGLVAGKVAEDFARPCIALAIMPESIKGSARSLPGINITELMRSVREHLIEVGGHPMAGGCALLPEKLTDFKTAIQAYAKKTIDPKLFKLSLELECNVDKLAITPEVSETIALFAPFGQGNWEPMFEWTNCTILECKTMGKEGQHWRLLFQTQLGQTIEAVAWSWSKKRAPLPAQTSLSLAGCIQTSEWKGRKKVQVVVKDLKVN